MTRYADFYRHSIDNRDAFWGEQAALIEWNTPPQQICDYSNPPFAKWFVGGTTNLCHNAVDRHLKPGPISQHWLPSPPKQTPNAATATQNCTQKCSAWPPPCGAWA